MQWVEQRKLVHSVNQSHPLKKKFPREIDWQEDIFTKFHDSFYKRESIIDQAGANKIVRLASQKWGLRIEQLYPEAPSSMHYSWGKTLGPRHGLIWVEHNMMYPSYVLHEIAHVVVECFIEYDLKGKSKLREEGHGILFAATLCNWLREYYADDESAMISLDYWFKPPRIHMASEESYEHFQKLFKNRTLL